MHSGLDKVALTFDINHRLCGRPRETNVYFFGLTVYLHVGP